MPGNADGVGVLAIVSWIAASIALRGYVAGADDRSTVAAMLSPPLLARRWSEGFVTLFTAAYRPAAGRLDYRWPDRRVPLRLDEPVPTEFSVELDDPDGA